MTFANPYNACTTCGVRVTDYDSDTGNVPCGHRGFDRERSTPERPTFKWTEHVDPWVSLCPSWGPVDGCECPPGEHGVPAACPVPNEEQR